MIFQQFNVNGMNSIGSQEFMNICKSHPSCKDCPLKNDDMDFQGAKLRCETGRRKENV